MRLIDFLKGEETCSNFNTSIKVHGSNTRNGAKGIRTKQYWCSYGPLDHRGPQNLDVPLTWILPDGSMPFRQSTKMGTSCRRGCRWHFTTVFKYRCRPHDVLLWFHHGEHKDKHGHWCHGLLDKTAKRAGAHIALHVSIELREEVERLLLCGVPARGILNLHNKEIQNVHKDLHANDEGDIIWSWDMLLDLLDILNVFKGIQK